MSKYDVFYGPHFPVFGLNSDKKKIRIWSYFAQCGILFGLYLSKAWNLINSFWTPTKWNIPELQLLPQVLKIRQAIIKSKDFFTTSKTITFFVVIFKSNFVGAPSIKENCTRFQFIRAEKDMSFSVISLCFFLYFKIGKNAVSDINITTRKT